MDSARGPAKFLSRTPPVAALCLGFAAIAVCTWLLSFQLLFLRVPPAWPDEGLFAAPAADLLIRGKLGTGLMDGILPGIGERTYWMPPAYFVALSAFFELAGVSLESLRAFSLLISLAVLGLVVALARRLSDRIWVAVFAVGLLAMSYPFVRASYVGRMEMLTLLFLLAGARLASQAFERQSALRVALAGLCFGLAGMTHPFGIVGPVSLVLTASIHSPREKRLRWLASIVIGVLIPALPWGLYILGDPQSFTAQFGVQLARKAGLDSGLWDRWCYNLSEVSGSSWPIGFAFTAGSLVGLWMVLRQQRSLAVLFWLQVATLAMLLSTREMWYQVYLGPLGALGWAVLLQWWSGAGELSRPIRITGVAAWVALSLVMVWGGQLPLAKARGEVSGHPERRTSYHLFAREISDSLPAGKRVLVSAIPDPTLDLMQRKDLQLRHFSPVPVARAAYRTYIAQADYIVIAGETDWRIKDIATWKGTLVRSVVVPGDDAYRAEIYRMR